MSSRPHHLHHPLSPPHPSITSHHITSLPPTFTLSPFSCVEFNHSPQHQMTTIHPHFINQSQQTMPSRLSFLPLLTLSLVLLLFPTNPQTSGPTMPEEESEILFRIMDSMSSDQDWRTTYPNPCSPGSSSWPGIECKPGDDHYIHVSRLDFGTPPNPSCKTSASFPRLIFSLPFLQSAFFFNCFAGTKTTLNFSSTGLLNSSLLQLSLRSNPALVGPIPSQISSLKSLQVLTLSQNWLSGNIPLRLFGMTSLVHLDLSYNLFIGTVPAQIGNLRNLVGLDLSYNSLTGNIPNEIGYLGRLQKLDLSSNSLVGQIPETVDQLVWLVFLALSNNGIGGKFPSGISKMQSLQYFIMENNPVNAALPVEFGSLARLQELRLSNSGYSGTIPPSFSRLANLSTLSLQNNSLTGQIPTGFRNLSHIYHLNLSRNSLSGVVPFDEGFLRRLGNNLDLSGNPALCLNPTESNGVNFGVNLCKNNSLILPLKSSQSPPSTFPSSMSIPLIFALGIHQITSFSVSMYC